MPQNLIIRTALLSHKILLDTSFAMQRGFSRFVREYADVFTHNRIQISSLVVRELERHLGDKQRRSHAKFVLEVLEKLIAQNMAEIRGEECNTFVDHVILLVAVRNMLQHNIIVLTNDVALAKDVRTITVFGCIRHRRNLKVIKLHGRTARPCFLSLHPIVTFQNPPAFPPL